MQKNEPKSGQPPGKSEPAQPELKKGAKRPVEEEDTFGGAERAQKGETVSSEGTKP